MKKFILISVAVVVFAAAAIALIRIPVQAASVDGAPAPSYGERLAAGLRAEFTNGRAEIQRSVAAKKEIKSFVMRTTLRLHPGQPLETLIEVTCPDRERFITNIGDESLQAVRIGSTAYIKQKDGSWTTQQTAGAGWAPCGDAPGERSPWAMMNEGRDLTPVLAKMSEKAEIIRGQFVGTASGPCQEWTLTFNHPGGDSNPHLGGGPGGGLRYTVCLSPNDHLPRRIVMGSGGLVTTYSDWNTALQIEPPKM